MAVRAPISCNARQPQRPCPALHMSLTHAQFPNYFIYVNYHHPFTTQLFLEECWKMKQVPKLFFVSRNPCGLNYLLEIPPMILSHVNLSINIVTSPQMIKTVMEK